MKSSFLRISKCQKQSFTFKYANKGKAQYQAGVATVMTPSSIITVKINNVQCLKSFGKITNSLQMACDKISRMFIPFQVVAIVFVIHRIQIPYEVYCCECFIYQVENQPFHFHRLDYLLLTTSREYNVVGS